MIKRSSAPLVGERMTFLKSLYIVIRGGCIILQR